MKTFGEDILLPDGSINRTKLGDVIFHNNAKRLKLNSIVHPAVRKRMRELAEKAIHNGAETVFMDIPLLFESKLTFMVEKTLLVYVDEEIQLTRLMNRNNLSEKDARARIASQMPLKEKRALADAVVNNNGDFEETKNQVRSILMNWHVL